jgi:type VI secretion system secreted protein Hcp
MADMFLNLEGIDGESIDEAEPVGHWKEIEIRDWLWNVSNPADHALKGAEAATKVVVDNITVFKHCDFASVNLLRFCTNGTHIKSARITCRKHQGEHKHEYLTIDMADVMIHKFDWKGIPESIVMEEITLEFAAFKVAYTVQSNRSDNDAPGAVDFGWDVQKHSETTVDKPPAKS